MKPLTPASPHAILMVGVPGAGKSTFAEHFADTFKALLLNRTKMQRELGLSDSQADFLDETILTEYIKTNRTLVIEGDLDSKEKREVLTKRLAKAGYHSLLVWVQTDTNEAFRRATKEYPKGSGLTEVEFDASVDGFEAPHPKEKAVVISGKHTYNTQLKIVLKQLAMKNAKATHAEPIEIRRSRSRSDGMIRG